MVKLKSTKAFKQTSRQLGARRAVREFKQVRPTFSSKPRFVNNLISSFVWDMTPQGHKFWCNIHEGRKPTHNII